MNRDLHHSVLAKALAGYTPNQNNTPKNFMRWLVRDLLSPMSTDQRRSRLQRAAIVKAFQEMSDELDRRETTGAL